MKKKIILVSVPTVLILLMLISVVVSIDTANKKLDKQLEDGYQNYVNSCYMDWDKFYSYTFFSNDDNGTSIYYLLVNESKLGSNSSRNLYTDYVEVTAEELYYWMQENCYIENPRTVSYYEWLHYPKEAWE